MDIEDLLERGFDPTIPFEEAQKVREDYIVRQHNAQLENIPLYKKIAESWVPAFGLDSPKDISVDEIRHKICSPFKIYKPEPQLIDSRDYSKLSQWLSQRFNDQSFADPSSPNYIDVSKAKSLDSWLSTLEQGGVYVTHSSGTSGKFSFVPWDVDAKSIFKEGIINIFEQLDVLDRGFHVVAGIPTGGYGTFAAPNEMLSELHELGAIGVFYQGIRRPMSADLLMAMRRDYGSRWLKFMAKKARKAGPANMNKFYMKMMDVIEDIVERKPVISVNWGLMERLVNGFENFHYKMKEADFGAPIIVNATPFQMNDLVNLGNKQGRSIKLPEGSAIVLGGGWKHDLKHKMGEEDLVKKLQTFFGEHVPVYDTYGMTEGALTALKLCKGSRSEHFKCDYHNFHLPQGLDAFVSFTNKEGEIEVSQESGSRGTFGFIMPIPSRISAMQSDDIVTLLRGCPCGYSGFAIKGEVTRDESASAEGCGLRVEDLGGM